MGKNTSGAGILVEDTRAGKFYRRAGFNGLAVRGKPSIRSRQFHVQIEAVALKLGDVAELAVYPELTIRSKPWRFWGQVEAIEDGGIILKQLSGEQKGTPIRIPWRYFEDGRVFQIGELTDDNAELPDAGSM
jgi:hypothetical protein